MTPSGSWARPHNAPAISPGRFEPGARRRLDTVLGLEGNVRARTGEGAQAVAMVRAALARALEHDLASAAAEVCQRLADSYKHAGEYQAAQATYKAAFGYCSANALEPMSQLCLGCLSVALRQAGDWAQADGVCRQVLSSPATTTLAGHRGAPLRHLALALGRDGVR